MSKLKCLSKTNLDTSSLLRLEPCKTNWRISYKTSSTNSMTSNPNQNKKSESSFKAMDFLKCFTLLQPQLRFLNKSGTKSKTFRRRELFRTSRVWSKASELWDLTTDKWCSKWCKPLKRRNRWITLWELNMVKNGTDSHQMLWMPNSSIKFLTWLLKY